MSNRNKGNNPAPGKNPMQDWEAALRLSESRYRRLFETAKDGILLLNFDTGQIEDVNPFLVDLLGYSLSEFKGKHIWEISPFIDIGLNKDAFAELQQKGYIRYEAMPLETRHGKNIQVEFISNVYDCDGIKVIQCNVRDITERKRIESALQQEKVFTDAVIGSAPGIFFVTDQNGNLIRWNSHLGSITGHSDVALGNNSALLLVHDEDKQLIADKLEEVFRTGSAHADARVTCHDQEVRNFSFSARRFELDGVSYMTGFGVDNTELKLAQNALLKEKAFLEATIESAPGAFFVVDQQNNLVRWNAFVNNVTGLDDDQLRGTPFISCIYEQDRPLATAKILAAFATGYPQKIELRVQTREHGLRVFFKTLRRFEVDGEHFLAIFGLDITEQKLIGDALAKEKEFSDALIESVPGAFFVVDPEGNYVRWNSYLNRLTGLSDAQLLHMPSLLTIQENDRPIAAATMKESFETGYSKAELHIITRDRGIRVFLMTARRFKVENSYYLVGVGVDTTDRQANELELELRALTDPLTGLPNRGHFMEMAAQELDRSRRYGHPLSLWMLDIDHFKNVNDTYGHHAGDLALQSLVNVSQKVLREMDIMGRLGGEEFAVLLPETDTEHALLVAERLRQKIAATQVPLEQGKTVSYTVSIGIATLSPDESGIDALLERADQSLYRAKNTGRDKVCIAEDAVKTIIEGIVPPGISNANALNGKTFPKHAL